MSHVLFILRLNKTGGATADILSLLPNRYLVSLQLGSLSETKRETIFEKPSFRGEASPSRP